MAQESDLFRTSGDVMTNFRREIDRLFGQFIGAGFPTFLGRQQPSQQPGEGRGGERTILPMTDIVEDESAYRIVMEIPGFEPANVEVNVAGTVLTVRAQQQDEQRKTNQNYIVNERTVGAIQRQFSIPDDVDREQINADFRNGILAITLRKSAQAQQQRRRIEIKTS